MMTFLLGNDGVGVAEGGCEDRLGIGDKVVENRALKLFRAAEMIADGGKISLRRLGDTACRDRGKAVFGEQLPGGLENSRPARLAVGATDRGATH